MVRAVDTGMDRPRWQARLDELCQLHAVPAAQLAVTQNGLLTEMASGVLNVDTGVEATTDSVFQIGSVTKTYTSVLVMQLVQEGRLELDQPVATLLPELRLADPESLAKVTMRHLLAHTSGIQGDHFEDMGRGDDVLARYVNSCATLGFSHPVGATMSYCNTGLSLAGRIIEKLTDQSWDDALHTRLVEPLGLTRTVTLPEEALRFRVAYGHHTDDGGTRLAQVWGLPRSLGPAGSICATAGEVVSFAEMHLNDGIANGGKQVLSAESVAEMQVAQVAIPDRWTLGSHWGLGWILFDWDGRRVYGHDGNTIGQAACLRVVPDAGVAIALLSNGGHAADLYQDLLRELMADLCNLDMPQPLTPPDDPPEVDVATHAGTYERLGVRIELEEQDGTLAGRTISTGPLAEIEDEPVEDIRLTAVTDSVFLTRRDGHKTWTPVVFYHLDDGTPYVHMGARATPKTGASPELIIPQVAG